METVTASNGVQLPLDSLAQTFAYNGSDQLTSIVVVYNNITYTQTFIWTGTLLTNISGWIAT